GPSGPPLGPFVTSMPNCTECQFSGRFGHDGRTGRPSHRTPRRAPRQPGPGRRLPARRLRARLRRPRRHDAVALRQRRRRLRLGGRRDRRLGSGVGAAGSADGCLRRWAPVTPPGPLPLGHETRTGPVPKAAAAPPAALRALDPIPHLLSTPEWAGLEAGLRQRARLLELLLADVYGPRELVARGVLPAEIVYGHPGFLRPCAGLAVPRRLV